LAGGFARLAALGRGRLMGLHLLRPMIQGSGYGRKKTAREKARRRRAKNTEEGDKYLWWGRKRNGRTDNFTLAVYMQFLVAADNQCVRHHFHTIMSLLDAFKA